jgi:hypothetical protein
MRYLQIVQMKALKFFTTLPTHPFRSLLRIAFWFGVVFLAHGLINSFVPGTAQRWFLLTGALLFCGLCIPNWTYRVASVVLIALCVHAALSDHQRGVDFHNQLQKRGSSKPLGTGSLSSRPSNASFCLITVSPTPMTEDGLRRL